MKVEELYDEMATGDSHLAHLQQADNPEYEVKIEAPDARPPYVIRGIRWEHQDKHMVIELE